MSASTSSTSCVCIPILVWAPYRVRIRRSIHVEGQHWSLKRSCVEIRLPTNDPRPTSGGGKALFSRIGRVCPAPPSFGVKPHPNPEVAVSIVESTSNSPCISLLALEVARTTCACRDPTHVFGRRGDTLWLDLRRGGCLWVRWGYSVVVLTAKRLRNGLAKGSPPSVGVAFPEACSPTLNR